MRTKRKQYRLLNDAEQILFYRLCEAMPNMQIFAQVVWLNWPNCVVARSQRLNQMAGEGVDFIVCGSNFGIVAAIELAWPTDDDRRKLAGRKTPCPAELRASRWRIILPPESSPTTANTISREIARNHRATIVWKPNGFLTT